jgi:hypothetical protein
MNTSPRFLPALAIALAALALSAAPALAHGHGHGPGHGHPGPSHGSPGPNPSPGQGKPPWAPGPGAPYRAAILGDHPAAYWRLGEHAPGQTLVAQDERNAYPGTYQGGPTLGVAHQLGKCQDDDTSADFDGLVTQPLGQWIQVADGDGLAFPGREPFTLEAWVHPHNLNTVTRRVFSKEGPRGGYLLGVRNEGLFFSRYVDGQWSTLQTSVDATNWTYVVATYDGSVMSVYINGWLSAQGPSDLELPSEREDLSIGAKQGEWRFFAGGLDELAIYDYALSNGRALAHYRTGGGTP